MKYFIIFNISTVQEVAPTQLYIKKHDTKISMVGDTLANSSNSSTVVYSIAVYILHNINMYSYTPTPMY